MVSDVQLGTEVVRYYFPTTPIKGSYATGHSTAVLQIAHALPLKREALWSVPNHGTPPGLTVGC